MRFRCLGSTGQTETADRESRAADPGRGALRPSRGGVRADRRRVGGVVAGGDRRGGRRTRSHLRGPQVGAGGRAGAQDGAPRGPAAGQRGPARNACLRGLCHRLHHVLRRGVQRPRGSRMVPPALAGRTGLQSPQVAGAVGPLAQARRRERPRLAVRKSSWSRCWRTSWSTMPAPFPPGDTTWRRRRPHSPWREFRFVHNQIRRAIEPAFGLARTIDEWNDIAKALSEPPRRRRPQWASYFDP